MTNESANIEWYYAEDRDKDLRQVVLCIPQGKHKESRFGTLLLSANYRNLTESEHGTGFFRMDSDAGPFLLTRLDGYTDKLVEGSIKIAFSFFRTECGGLVGVYVGMESRSLCEAFDKPYPFLEMINGLDERDTTVKLYEDAFSNDTLVVSIADRSMSTTSFYDENSGSFSEASSPQCVYDIDIDLPQECRELLQKELAEVLGYHDNMPGYSRDFQQSVQCVYGVMPMGENPILPMGQKKGLEKMEQPVPQESLGNEELSGVCATEKNSLNCPIAAEGNLGDFIKSISDEGLSQISMDGSSFYDEGNSFQYDFSLKEDDGQQVINIDTSKLEEECVCISLTHFGYAFILETDVYVKEGEVDELFDCPIDDPLCIALSPINGHLAIANGTDFVIYDFNRNEILGSFPVPNSYSGTFNVFRYNETGDLITGQYASQIVYRFDGQNEYNVHLDMSDYGTPDYCCHDIACNNDDSLWCSEMMSPILLWVNDKGEKVGDALDLDSTKEHGSCFRTMIAGDEALDTVYISGSSQIIWKCDRKQKSMQEVSAVNFEVNYMALLSDRYLLAVGDDGCFAVVDLEKKDSSNTGETGGRLPVYLNGYPQSSKAEQMLTSEPENTMDSTSNKPTKRWWQFWK